MSFLTYQLPDNTLDKAVAFIQNQEYAVKLDALLNIYVGINESSKRLYGFLLEISQSNDKIPQPIRQVSTAVWELLDGLDRAFTIGSQMVAPPPQTKDIMREVSLARNSFHHLEDRIKHFYADNQGSVFGDIYWRYRPSLGEKEVGNFYFTGPAFDGPRLDYGVINLPKPELAHESGVYDLHLYYIAGTPKNDSHKPIDLYIDNASREVSSLMHFLYASHKKGLEDFANKRPNSQLPDVGLRQPMYMRFL
jgi:hypothetical protein